MKDSTIKTSSYIFGISSIIFLITFWLVFSKIMDNNFVYPTIGNVFVNIGKLLGKFETFEMFLFSLERIIVVIFLSFSTSFLLTFLYCLYPPTYTFFKPLIAIMKASPLAIISIYIWVVVGSNLGPYLITYLVITPIICENMVSSIKAIPQKYKNELLITNVSIFYKFFKVYIPLITPYILISFLQSFGLGIKVMMMAEYICQTSHSVGKLIYDYKASMEFDYLIAILVIVIIIVLIFDWMISKLQNKIKKSMD